MLTSGSGAGAPALALVAEPAGLARAREHRTVALDLLRFGRIRPAPTRHRL
ncbi:hypothetical protein J2S52_005521 [Streptomyces sp. DSM 41037]|nr:hypothetical protein [Streptomyces sp. DSM 41037]